MTAHTPEPWQSDRNCVFVQPGAVRWWIANTNTIRGASGYYASPIAEAETEAGIAPKHECASADAARIVECVNACAGLNPAEIPALIEAAEIAHAQLIGCECDEAADALSASLKRVKGEK